MGHTPYGHGNHGKSNEDWDQYYDIDDDIHGSVFDCHQYDIYIPI